ncbi:MAG: DUF2252 domain-containing protein [Bryobacteraceae bacterium]
MPAPVPSASQRIAEGKRLRDAVPRQAHVDLHPKDRSFDPIAVLLASGRHRVHNLLPIKYARMKVSPFAFFRGAVSIMAADLARLPHSSLLVQLCGDAHVQNLGSFAAPDGKLVFDLNDFDETIPGPWEWDVKRMATSLVLAGRESGHGHAHCYTAAAAFVSSYCRAIDAFSGQPVLQVARYQVHREERIAPIHAALRQSERARPLDLLKRFTVPGSKGRHFLDQPPLFHRIRGQAAHRVLTSLRPYRESLVPDHRHLFDLLRPVDVGFKVVGTGSVGLRDYVVYLEGNGPRDPLFLQIKQEVASAYSPFLSGTSFVTAAPGHHQGRRVAEGQRAIQPRSDLLLGWTTMGSHQYLVRQLNDHKGKVDLQLLRGSGLKNLALVAGELLARGHARSGDACRIRGYCGSGEKITKALGEFATEYADQTEADYRAFLAAIKSGKIKVA